MLVAQCGRTVNLSALQATQSPTTSPSLLGCRLDQKNWSYPATVCPAISSWLMSKLFSASRNSSPPDSSETHVNAERRLTNAKNDTKKFTLNFLQTEDVGVVLFRHCKRLGDTLLRRWFSTGYRILSV